MIRLYGRGGHQGDWTGLHAFGTDLSNHAARDQ
jgi:hypothetical protein